MQKLSDEIKMFIEATKWTYAKTMPEWKHFYIVRSKVSESLFIKLVQHIRTYGYLGAFYNETYTYFEEEGFIYWTMGNPINETTIINRTAKENSYEERLKNGTLLNFKLLHYITIHLTLPSFNSHNLSRFVRYFYYFHVQFQF